MRKKRSVAFREPLVSMANSECGGGADHPSPVMEVTMVKVSTEGIESNPLGQQAPIQDPVSEIPYQQNETKKEEFVTIDMPPNLCTSPKSLLASTSMWVVGSPSNSVTSSKGLSPKPGSNIQSGTLNMEEVAILALGGLQHPPSERSPLLRSKSLSGLSALIKRAASMPPNPVQPSNTNSTDDFYIVLNPTGGEVQQPIYRSRSVPARNSNGTNRESPVKVLRVVPGRSATDRNTRLSNASSVHGAEDVEEEEISETEAVCRICFEELGDEQEPFNLECNCRGELSLVHRECIQRWLDIKGDRTCEICREEVKSITVKIRRRPIINLSSFQGFAPPPVLEETRVWHEFPILVITSIVAYFMSFLALQKLRKGGGDDASLDAPFSVPFSCILGLVTSLIAASYVHLKNVYYYGIAQYVVFAVLAIFLYNLIHLKLFLSFTMAGTLAIVIVRSACPVYLKWKDAQANQLDNSSEASHEAAATPGEATVQSRHSNASHHQSND